ncbi:hypothetical protein BEWA_024800 [Theileria equi strain WA]|uniref:Poly(A)-specific ribonuclease PARN n=1 Tax=Theileria equi strain WA TaxID=1537102 RepID=L0AX81_THEEQ|nr:hypothetical protein BEWA_024800 [Theileria equi strain WA]AFZ79631.1 hypothetical protein BEWA_024800 [Theileria equi strain WA]|eukprot:XP_004829297.1 hypothetical protein BEWA_024800 [Theileria equi strain WA]
MLTNTPTCNNTRLLRMNRMTQEEQVSNITSKLTWEEHRNIIIEAIKNADFIAFDMEYTGLHLKDDRYVGIDKCYEAHSAGAKQFIPCQIGLTMAKLENGVWNITPTSIYTFPSDNTVFKVNTSTISFLKDNNFDFNSWIRNGVLHLKPHEEQEKKKVIEERLKELQQMLEMSKSNTKSKPSVKPVKFNMSTIPDENDRNTAISVMNKIEEWIDSDDIKPLEIPMESAFQRLLMHTIIGQQYPQIFSHSTRRGNDKALCIYKSEYELYNEQILQLKSEMASVDEEVGLRLLLDAISANKKIIVGHNCFYDILHIYQTFYKDLPESVQEFKDAWISKHPHTFDTKYIAESQDIFSNNTSTTLKGLFDHLCATEVGKSVEFVIKPLPNTTWNVPTTLYPLISKRYLNTCGDLINDINVDSVAMHDAGYDSFMTSIVFILQVNAILRSKNTTIKSILEQNTKETRYEGELPRGNHGINKLMSMLEGVVNSIRLVKSQPNVMNLNKSSENDMARHFYMFGFPNTWKKWEITKIWSPLWISISWIDETSCWIIVKNDDDVRNIDLIYRMMRNPQFKLYTYQQYLQNIK